MEVLLAIIVLYWVCLGTYRALRASVARLRSFLHQRRATRQADQTANEASRQQQLRRESDRRLVEQQATLRNRQMQLAILNLATGPDPDFRRAAAAAQDAQAVPADFRRRQFQRFRPQLVRHYASCLQRGCEPDVVHSSLVDLVNGMGMPEFEADYVRQESDRIRDSRTGGDGEAATTQFQTRLTQLQRSHDQRMEIIRTLTNLADDVRAQLLEAEERRFQEQLFGRNAV